MVGGHLIILPVRIYLQDQQSIGVDTEANFMKRPICRPRTWRFYWRTGKRAVKSWEEWIILWSLVFHLRLSDISTFNWKTKNFTTLNTLIPLLWRNAGFAKIMLYQRVSGQKKMLSILWCFFVDAYSCSIQITTSIYPVPCVNSENQMADWFKSLAECLHWNVRQRQRQLSITDCHV